MDTKKYELIESSKQYALKLSNGIHKEIDVFRMGKNVDISNLLLIVEGMRYLIKVLSLTTDVFQEKDCRYETVAESLNSLTEAIENEDFISITDVLEYEFLPLIKEWTEIFNNELRNIIKFPG